MPLNVRSEEVNLLAERLAARKHTTKTEAVKLALENELRRVDEAVPLRERLRPLQEADSCAPGDGVGRRQGVLRRTQRRRLMFVDASAIVAILTGEPEAPAFADLLDGAPIPTTSPIAMSRHRRRLPQAARERRGGGGRRSRVSRDRAIEIVPTTTADAETALDAHSRYGKGRGHPAQLNLGDCFAYAVARRHGVALLFKGEDFDKTDIQVAAPVSG